MRSNETSERRPAQPPMWCKTRARTSPKTRRLNGRGLSRSQDSAAADETPADKRRAAASDASAGARHDPRHHNPLASRALGITSLAGVVLLATAAGRLPVGHHRAAKAQEERGHAPHHRHAKSLGENRKRLRPRPPGRRRGRIDRDPAPRFQPWRPAPPRHSSASVGLGAMARISASISIDSPPSAAGRTRTKPFSVFTETFCVPMVGSVSRSPLFGPPMMANRQAARPRSRATPHRPGT